MDFEGGGYPLEMQAKKVVDNIMAYNGSHPCPTCGIIMNPVEFLSSNKGRCLNCVTQERAKRAKNKMVL
jgi:hypothetical protein